MSKHTNITNDLFILYCFIVSSSNHMLEIVTSLDILETNLMEVK